MKLRNFVYYTVPPSLLLFTALASAVIADPLLSKSEIAAAARTLDVCITNESDTKKCIGLIQTPCDDAISAGGEAAHATCADNETAAWDVLLNETWSALPSVIGPARFAELKKVQKTWLTYRGAKCGFLKSADGGAWGLMLASQCSLEETSRRVLELREVLSDPNFAAP